MKYRTDFVTNSSSTSFAAAATSVIAALLTALGVGSCVPPESEMEHEQEGYSLQVSPRHLTVSSGGSAFIDITVFEFGEDGESLADDAAISLSAGVPGLSVSPDGGQGELTAEIAAAADLAPGTYAVAVSATADGKTIRQTVTIVVEQAVELELTYPVGRSPKVFATGWLFGARCIAGAGTGDEQDLSEEVQWSGTGSFAPAVGSQSRPSFAGPGSNTITLTCRVGEREFRRDFPVEAVSTAGYARLGDQARVEADAHGCPACPHFAIGPIIAGNDLVLIDGLPAVRVGDAGVHAACCGPNEFTVIEGDPEVLIGGKPAAQRGSATQHCGGVGKIVEASAGASGA